MSTLKNPPAMQDRQEVALFRKKIASYSLESTYKKLNEALDEMADMCVFNIATAMRNSYCEQEKLHLIPAHLRPGLEAEAALAFIRQNEALNERVHKRYVQQEGA